MAAEARRFFKAHRGRRLVARPGQFAQQRSAASAQKTHRAPHPLGVTVAVDTQIARRRAVPHLPVDARGEILARRELAATGAQAENSRKRANRMLDSTTPD